MTEMNNPIKSNICEEAPVDLFINGKKLVTFMCTPSNLKELAVGYLYSRRLIKSLKDINVLSACDDMRQISINIKKEIPQNTFTLSEVLTSGCGGGMPYDESILLSVRNISKFSIDMQSLKKISEEMFSRAILYKTMGGLHCSCIANGEGILALREDIGRHNAVDKVIGKGLFLNLDFSHAVIFSTGRISSDMLLKAAVSGLPIVVSRSIPSNLAIEMAEKMGITVVGRVMLSEPIIYTHSYRIS